MQLDIKYSESIRVLGPPYYISDYKHWDLQRCHNAFYGPEYDSIIDRLKKNQINLYNGDATMAVVHLDKYRKDNYHSCLSTNVKRDIKKAADFYYFKEYSFEDYIPDFCDINKSQQIKKGKVNPWYLQDPSWFISDKEKINYWEEHYTKWYGVFRFQKHYKQFDKKTNEKLISYCQVMVDGEMATVGLVWGHGSHLKNGTMFYLLTSVISDLTKNDNIKSLV